MDVCKKKYIEPFINNNKWVMQEILKLNTKFEHQIILFGNNPK